MNPILEQFLSEARENLLFLDKNLGNLNSGDNEIINALFRSAHTLKGSSGLAGFHAVKDTTHIAEDLLDAYRNEKIESSERLMEALYDMFDEVTELVDAAEECGDVICANQEKLDGFRLLREEILNIERGEETGIDTEINIIDDEVPNFANLVKNNFSDIDLDLIPFEPQPVTLESFESMNYYFVDIDLSRNTLELGNDPFYAVYMLGNENIISVYTDLSLDFETLKKDPLQWGSWMVLLVKSDRQQLEDAFFNFLDEVTIYPLCVKGLFNADLKLQSNDSIKDFIEDLKKVSLKGDLQKIFQILNAVKDIVNPDSLQGFLFSRFNYIIKNFQLSEEKISNMMNYIFELSGIEKQEILKVQTDDYEGLDESRELKEDNEQTLSEISQEIKSVKKDIQAQEQADTSKEKKTSKPISKTVKIDLEEIDNMMDIVGEMLVIKNSLPYIAQDLNNSNVELSKRDLLARYDEINRVTTQLQEKVMHMRLLSLSFIFDRYPKLVRDISKSLDKKIKYREEGGDTKLDKTIIEKLADPLIHIIRNSLDHGIERKEERKLKGKDPQGQISIKAESLGDKVYITIQDDGKGIDLDRVVEKSLEKKMVTKEELEDMSEQQKLMLVFHPGVSTMEQISELSGRGVGMDVVRQTIDEVGGKISLNSEIDKGTKITLELPMSVALSNVFHVKLGNANYALSMDCISETVRVRNKDVEYINRKPMLKLRGDLIPLIFYYELLSKDIDNKGSYSLLIVQTQGAKFGFVVDEFVNQLDIVQKPLSSNFKNHPFISGTSLLGNGEVLFVINPVKLINLKEK